jgi:hypothetical protein
VTSRRPWASSRSSAARGRIAGHNPSGMMFSFPVVPAGGQPSMAMICGSSTLVRMPGAAAQTIGTALTARWAV